MKFWISLLVMVLLYDIVSAKEKVDMLVRHATIYPVNASNDTASVLVIHQGKIIALGNDDLYNRYTADTNIDATGQFLYPGFIDAHCHFAAQALDAYKLKLFGTTSFSQIVEKLKAYSEQNNRFWIEASGWDQNDWPIKKFPTKDTLDILFPDRPVFLLRVDGHAALVNQKALDLSGIDIHTHIDGGEIEINNGKLSGILTDNALEKVRKQIPSLRQEEREQYIREAQSKYFSVGLCSVVEPGIDTLIFRDLQSLYNQHLLSMRVSVFLDANTANVNRFSRQQSYQNDQLHLCGFKMYVDGSLGSRGALLVKPYTDRHEHYGVHLMSKDSLLTIVKAVSRSPYQLAAHAIGDAANHDVLQSYASVLSKKNKRRWRIEHAQVVDPKDLSFFRDYHILPSVQPSHAMGDMDWAKDRLGKQRMPYAYAYHDLLETNGLLPLGTDYPVEDLNPLHTFVSAVFRCNESGLPQGGFQPENRLSRLEALRGITLWAAYSVFEEKQKGSLEPGKLADFVLLDTDLMRASREQIQHAKVLSTWVSGRCVYMAN